MNRNYIIAIVAVCFIASQWALALAVADQNKPVKSACIRFEDGSARCAGDHNDVRLKFCMDHTASVPELAECFNNV